MQLYPLNKIVLSISNNPEDFLQGITSNNINAPQNAFLNISGRIVATFDQILIQPGKVLIVIDADVKEKLMAHLSKYILLSGVDIQQTEHHVYFDISEQLIDVPKDTFVIEQWKGRLILSKEILLTTVSDDEFCQFRLLNNIPLHGVDYKDEFILNVNEEDFVSFSKGCFLGQEPVSKVHHRSKPTWKLVVKDENDCVEEELSRLTSRVTINGNVKGFVFTKND